MYSIQTQVQDEEMCDGVCVCEKAAQKQSTSSEFSQAELTYFGRCRITLLTNPSIASLFGRLFQRRVQTTKMVAEPAFITPASGKTYIAFLHQFDQASLQAP